MAPITAADAADWAVALSGDEWQIQDADDQRKRTGRRRRRGPR